MEQSGERVSLRQRGRGGPASVVDELRDDIIALKLAPGTVLARADLQNRFGMSSTPIRDAVMRLQEEGLVEVFPQHATVVSPIDLDLARQAQFLRRSLELEVVETLAAAPPPGLADELRQIIRRQRAFDMVGEFQSFSTSDTDFHRTLFEAARVPELWRHMRRQSGHIDRLRRLNLPEPGKIREILRDHEAVVAAIEAGDGALAREEMRGHLSRSLNFAETLKSRHPDYFRR